MAGLEQAHGSIELVVEIVIDPLLIGHVAIDHQPALQRGDGPARLAQFQRERVARRQFPRPMRIHERLIVLDRQLQVVGGVEAEDRLDGVDEALGRRRVAIGVGAAQHPVLAELIPERLVILGSGDIGQGQTGTKHRCRTKQSTSSKPHH